MPIKHPFVSGKADGGDATKVRPSNWNADHTSPELTADAEVTVSGATTVDWTTSHTKDFLTGAADITFTFTAPATRAWLGIRLKQGATARLVTWPATVKWPGGTAPVLSAATKLDMFNFYYDGTTYWGSSALNYTP